MNPARHEAGPDEALCCIWDAIDGDGDIAERLAEVRASGHPEAEHVASSAEAFAASGAQQDRGISGPVHVAGDEIGDTVRHDPRVDPEHLRSLVRSVSKVYVKLYAVLTRLV